jgi:CRP/FNR family transcriptional regulator
MVSKNILTNLKFLCSAEDEIISSLQVNAVYKKIEKSSHIYLEGDTCAYFAFILSGVVRVYKLGENGREITLYRLSTGESCILTASCVMSTKSFPAFSLAEKDVEVILLPSILFKEWVIKYNFWREYVFSLLTERLSSVLSIIDEIAFKRVDKRLLEFLIKQKSNQIKITHNQIASEIGTSREVISRILKDLENENLVSLSRGIIKVVDHNKLSVKHKNL